MKSGVFEMLAMIRFLWALLSKSGGDSSIYIPDFSGLGRDYCLPVEAAIRFL